MKMKFNKSAFVFATLAVSWSVGAWAQGNDQPETAPPAPQEKNDTSTPPAPAFSADMFDDAKLTDGVIKNGINPAIVRAEVLLDRTHNSPGVIDGRDGLNFEHALAAYEKRHDLNVTKGLDEKVWSSLTGDDTTPVVITYKLTDKDVAGPFFPDLPKDYGELAKLKEIGYRTPSQKIAAIFHMSETLLQALNPDADLTKAGTEILVTNVVAKPAEGTIKKVTVNKTTSQVLGLDAHGHVLVSYPATIGSEELPSPSGTYKIKGIAFNPVYYYDPDKNFLQGNNKEKLKLPPGPNNPVGSVFIALTKPTYGLHGSPDPEKIDKTSSHGCVRMTNWDANELARLVKPGIIVRFTGRKSN
jgi:lipoprotein-anchoring transpeptidase ErfK/SrfK